MNKKYVKFCGLCLYMNSMNTFAGILADRTRVIYLEGQREVSLMLNNTNDYPIMTQIWIDHGVGDPDTAKAPFSVLAPMFSIQAAESKEIRIMFTNAALPQDRESVYWLNLHETPALEAKELDDNQISLSMNTQMKVFYRPKQLKNIDIQHLNKQLKMTNRNDVLKQTLEIKNTSPYYVSMASLSLKHLHSSEAYRQSEHLMIPPYQSQMLRFTQPIEPQTQVNYTLIDDQGLHHLFQTQL